MSKKKDYEKSGAKPKKNSKFKQRKVHQMDEQSSDSDSSGDDLNHMSQVNSMDNKGNEAMYVSPRVNGKKMSMQIDTGSARSIITLTEFKDKFPEQPLKNTSVMFKTYTGQLVRPTGKFTAKVKLQRSEEKPAIVCR